MVMIYSFHSNKKKVYLYKRKSLQKKIIIGITGASGSLYAQKLLALLHEYRSQVQEIAIVFTEDGKNVWKYELGDLPEELPGIVYDNADFFAPVASGSAGYDTMIVCPCSMGTLSRIATGTADNLIARAADVMLKERRKLILVTRETPLSLIHIRNMETLTLAGGIVMPASPGFYNKPAGIDEMAEDLMLHVLELAGLEVKRKRWGNTIESKPIHRK